MIPTPLTLLVVGATGSIGQHVVDVALEQGHRVTALCRSAAKAAHLPAGANTILADVAKPETLRETIPPVDAVIFTLGSDGLGKNGAMTIDYGGVYHVLMALRGKKTRIALMTSIGVTDRAGSYNQRTEAHDWKRRSERLVRASGHPYTIVRPGWFDYHSPNQHHITLLQGDQRHTGTPDDGVISRRQIAEILVASLTDSAAVNKTFELVAEKGRAQTNLTPLFASLTADRAEKNDGIFDIDNMAEALEPERVKEALRSVAGA
ncbi:SDR family oxidoreductase [Pectobacterium polaris]|uniref:SDR family oxidoreductase n=1 Tax=Pectobacterium polaris TaxID=2042057 RepID=A0AAW5G6Q1_9GAMM|nr:SDR family oxidoreductase [Pectobacterium polaris]MCL6349976.1 SDR family oxidoreductase [Pectobacterium polaris]MCL6367374.1 SDR family oxidoreductase [Pectobacterium polaris]